MLARATLIDVLSNLCWSTNRKGTKVEQVHCLLLKPIGAHFIFEPVAPDAYYPTWSIGKGRI